MCEYIKFLKTVPNDKTYFEMIIYNPDKNPVRVKYRRYSERNTII